MLINKLNEFQIISTSAGSLKDERIAIAYYEKLRWDGNPICLTVLFTK